MMMRIMIKSPDDDDDDDDNDDDDVDDYNKDESRLIAL